MKRRFFGAILAFAVAATVTAPPHLALAQRGLFGPPAPVAPQTTQRRGLLEMLFGPRTPAPPPPSQPRATRPPVAAAPEPPKPPPVEKDPQARKILVVGDFVGAALASGLEDSFATEPRLRVVDRTNPNSGLVRQDYYDWIGELPGILKAEQPAIVVVAIGANDRQGFRAITPAPSFPGPEWEAAYAGRIQAFAALLKTSAAPFFWVSAPPMRASAAERDMAYLNGLFTPRVAAAGGVFVDIWNGFADDEGHFVASGPDVDGQTRSLRTGNGTNFTEAGRQKLAFYVAREIRRRTGIGTGTVNLAAPILPQGREEVGADGVRRRVGAVISLRDPPAGAGTVLAGERRIIADRLVGAAVGAPLIARPKDRTSPQYRLVVMGEAPAPVIGRADDFTWPKRSGAAPLVAQADAPVAAKAPAATVAVAR